jgi:hypothetical protein
MKVQIEGYTESHEVFTNGVVINTKTQCIIQPTENPNGYLKVSLNYKGSIKQISLHRLVALHFLPNPKMLPQVNHIDGDKKNNSANNLEWCTCSYNRKHAIRNGLIPGKTEVVSTTELPILLKKHAKGETIRSMARTLGVQQECLASVLRKYAEEVGKLNMYAEASKKARGSGQVKNRKKVIQYNLGGDIVALHTSLHAAAKAVNKTSPGGVSGAVNRGHMSKYEGYLWSWG